MAPALLFFVDEADGAFRVFVCPDLAGAFWATAYGMLSICSPKKNNVTFVIWRK
jgi:hypothetical protein